MWLKDRLLWKRALSAGLFNFTSVAEKKISVVPWHLNQCWMVSYNTIPSPSSVSKVVNPTVFCFESFELENICNLARFSVSLPACGFLTVGAVWAFLQQLKRCLGLRSQRQRVPGKLSALSQELCAFIKACQCYILLIAKFCSGLSWSARGKELGAEFLLRGHLLLRRRFTAVVRILFVFLWNISSEASVDKIKAKSVSLGRII